MAQVVVVGDGGDGDGSYKRRFVRCVMLFCLPTCFLLFFPPLSVSLSLVSFPHLPSIYPSKSLLFLAQKRKIPRIKTEKFRTSKRNLQKATLTPESITTAFSQTKLSTQQSTPPALSSTAFSQNESSLDERIEKKRREREL